MSLRMRRPLALHARSGAVIAFALLVATLGAATFAAPAGAADRLAAVTITGTTDEKPTVAVAKPVSVKSTFAKMVTKGEGDKATKNSVVNLDYVFVNGRTGAELETSYGRGSVSLPLDRAQTQSVLVDHLVGARVGSRMVIVIAPNEGMAEQLASDSIRKDDTLLFVVDLHSAHVPLDRAEGTEVAPVEGLPTVKLARGGAPTISMPKGEAPSSLVVQPLVEGDGPVVQAGQTVTVHYKGAIWDGGRVFDSSWKRGQAVPFAIGVGQVVQGWDDGLVGQTVGSQVLLVIPPELGYGPNGNSGAGIEGTDTLVFVVDILDAY